MDSRNYEKDRLMQILVGLFSCYGKADDHTQLGFYYKNLEGYPFEIVDLGIKLVVQSHLYSTVPTVGEIFAKMLEANEMLHPELRLPAWVDVQTEIVKAQYNVPYNSTPKWSHPLIGEVVKSFGWYTIATIEADRQNILLAQIRKAYESACERTRSSRLRELNTVLFGIGAGGSAPALDTGRQALSGKPLAIASVVSGIAKGMDGR